MVILSYLISAISLVCWIMVLIKVFQSKDTTMGILCICPLVAFIYGWIKSKALNIQPIMMAWTGAIVLNIILNVVIASSR